MLRVKIASIAIAAVSVVGIGAGLSSTANAATTTTVTTNFTFPSDVVASPTLNVDNGNAVPANGTAVTFDLQKFVTNASVVLNGTQGSGDADTGTILADDIASAAKGLETASSVYQIHSAFGLGTGTLVSHDSIPASDFSNLPTEVIPSAGTPSETDPVTNTKVNFNPALTDDYNLSTTGDTTVTLYVEGATANTFEVSGTNGGPVLNFTHVSAIDPSLASSVSWGQASTAPAPPVATRSFVSGGHVVTVNNNDATFSWTGVTNGAKGNCVVTETFGYGMTNSAGSPHYGYTCGTTGYLTGLKAGHTYDVELIPAAANASFANRIPDPNGQAGWITVVTTK